MLRRVTLLFAALLCLVAARAAPAPLSDYERVAVAPTKTSIYIGSVSMAMPVFARTAETYESTYTAKVFPYFFYNEQGRLNINVSDEDLRRLEAGEPIEFTGSAVRSDGLVRRVEGKATPADASGGKIKVRVFVSERVELIFNTTYRFPDAKPVATPSTVSANADKAGAEGRVAN